MCGACFLYEFEVFESTNSITCGILKCKVRKAICQNPSCGKVNYDPSTFGKSTMLSISECLGCGAGPLGTLLCRMATFRVSDFVRALFLHRPSCRAMLHAFDGFYTFNSSGEVVFQDDWHDAWAEKMSNSQEWGGIWHGQRFYTHPLIMV